MDLKTRSFLRHTHNTQQSVLIEFVESGPDLTLFSIQVKPNAFMRCLKRIQGLKIGKMSDLGEENLTLIIN